MPARVGTVKLELLAAQYKREAREVEVRTLAAKREIDDLGDTADKTAAETEVLGASMGRAKRQIDEVGDKARKSSRELVAMAAAAKLAAGSMAGTGNARAFAEARGGLARIDAAVAILKQDLKALEQAYNATGDAALLFGIKQRRSQISTLTTLRGVMGRSLASAGGDALNTATSALSFDTGKLKMYLVALAIPAVAALLPTLGAMVAGAVTGIAGTGGVIGGILAAKDDPRVRAAATSLADQFGRAFDSAGTPMVEPLQHALHDLSDSLEGLHLENTFRIAAPWVDQLAKGIGGMATQFMPLFNKALAEADPVMRELAHDLPEVGHALGEMFDSIASGKGNAEGLRATFMLLNGTLRGVGNTLEALSNAFAFSIDKSLGLANALRPMLHWIPGVGRALDLARHSMMTLSDATGHGTEKVIAFKGQVLPVSVLIERQRVAFDAQAAAAKKSADALENERQRLEDLTRAQTESINRTLDMYDAQTQLKQSQADLTESVKENGRSLDINTQKGRNNRRALGDLLAQAEAVREELLRNPATAATANAAYAAMVKKIGEFATKLGLSRSEVNKLIASLLRIPTKITVGIDIRMGGESHAAGTIHTSTSTTSGTPRGTTTEKFAITYDSRPTGGGAFATGGRMAPGELAWVGDPGPYAELVRAGSGGAQVYNAPTSAAMAGRAPATAQIVSAIGASALDPAVLARAVAAALQGMTVVMDGRVVGALQGRRADLYARAG